MNTEIEAKYLTRAVVSLIKLQGLIKDTFFSRKLSEKIYKLMADYLAVQSSNKDGFVQQGLLQKFTTDLDFLLELLQDLNYLRLVPISPLFLDTTKLILLLKLSSMKTSTTLTSTPTLNTRPVKNESIESSVSVKRQPRLSRKLGKSRQMILDFIKSYPDTRTKDIVREFSALSDRSVKRNLTELLRYGLVKKRVDSKAVYYSSIDS
ncbi:MAG: hypothetical protein A3B91_03285 [Candidatus Yanofskybacteria bacterium RIFCSPHIGHO2_02_FULL_41_29]|uniref:Uncharacterized protein n=1 Tax=Candidatus Yanofskybacteria bacterium RIFCSPHIGHO2_01_FULL_41_53 TaxID=1802663 RepID=A0A1F8EGN8_9BACT|nr:MAG: hypothetical protein A2650_01110 [Candidatus Yanofskybacteria bacterium RIFCSPHIGHO2_01_FULL_41_53]OGN10687.1 MAG: hypothetical protein A3B91_03285 [Candidatus Yanofskybacteria bacterium RIFCSPHIGHO2_02_FULL_41_29]OGN18135.1 MAG: hypothetical protein A3F48_02300 [Candidatus Yanofskybacteria bacterium RIFCSPHIGHO2_12_FULL_41_9]OGN24055.1 MAG: hypothetical protein A2916_04845 [Candidatus Yanofskybacteria bacterium RIFCSPLOWO2_01_FULL_41_67]OGN30486.1 MAG: hypothetical protein A3H54_00455 